MMRIYCNFPNTWNRLVIFKSVYGSDFVGERVLFKGATSIEAIVPGQCICEVPQLPEISVVSSLCYCQ